MTCYAIGHIEVTDAERYQDYASAVLAQVSRIGGKILAAGRATVLEGAELPNLNVIIEFPDEDAAMAWYASEEYQAVRPIRLQATTSSQIALVRAAR
jgi:uncharacterized protein (DUF1330 family)